jgi:hypothetical protein
MPTMKFRHLAPPGLSGFEQHKSRGFYDGSVAPPPRPR